MFDKSFISNETEILFEILFPLIRESAIRGSTLGYDLLQVDLGVDFNRNLNATAIEWAINNTTNVVAAITKTNVEVFVEKFEKWANTGQPLSALLEMLEPHYGSVRGEMIGVTETTRAFESAKLLAWKLTNLVKGKRWNNVNDRYVSDICIDLGGKQVDIDDKFIDIHGKEHDGPPGHVRCRSYLSPVMARK